MLLARDVAALIVRSSVAEGDRLFDAGEEAPDGSELGDRIARAQWDRRQQQKQIEWERDTTPNEDEARATEAAIAALRAMQEATE